MAFRIGIDIGGTFTDFTVIDDGGTLLEWKEDTVLDEPTRAIAAGLNAVAGQLELSVEEFLESSSLLVHGTTIATNTVIQRNGPRIGLLCTKGFRDVLYYRDGFKPERFNIHLAHPTAFVDRYLRLEVDERINRDGDVLRPLDEDSVREAAASFREAGVEAVAASFLWAMMRPDHERRAAEILSVELPGVPVVISSDALPEIREWERTSATVLSAYVLPGIARYFGALEQLLRDAGLKAAPLIMQVNGGCASVAEVTKRPVYALASGPAAAPAAAVAEGKSLGWKDLISVDMGGTSFDVCVIRDGHATMSREIQVEDQPIGVSGVEVKSVGAGGGSIAWIDKGGALQVGPRSAGARPGPACYGIGGDEPTVTDANVMLGYLAPEAFLGGRRVLRGDLAEAAIERRVGEPLGLDALHAAAGVIRVVNANMVNAIRAVSIARGVDPRAYALVVGGGAGGLHACRLARELGMSRVLIPQQAGAFCAFGMTVTDVRHDRLRTMFADSADIVMAEVDSVFRELEDEGEARLRAEGFAGDQIALERSVDVRYVGQVHELTIPIPGTGSYSAEDVSRITEIFHAHHEQQFAFSRPDLPIEFLHWRVSATGRLPAGQAESRDLSATDGHLADLAKVGTRPAYSAERDELVPTPVYSAESLRPGASIRDQAIIQAATTTVVLSDGDALTVLPNGSYSVLVETGVDSPQLAGGMAR